MQVVTQAGELTGVATDLLVLGVYSEELDAHPALKVLDRALGGAVKSAMTDEDFKARAEQRLMLPTQGKLRARRVAILGLGKKKEKSASTLMHLGGAAVRLGNAVGAKHVLLSAPKDGGDSIELLSRGASLGTYRFDRYLTDKGRKPSVVKLALHVDAKAGKVDAALERGRVVAAAMSLSRDLVNEAPIALYPESFAKLAASEAKKHGLGVKIYDPAALAKMNMNLLLAVGMGSARGPRLVHLTYTPKGGAKGKPVVLVGKGITFDSGGLCLKPPDGMMDMKVDMGGAAAVLGAMCAIGKLAPKVEVHGVLTLAENMPSGTAYRLGDVIRAASGRTVEINNTDAEGRLVLADAIHYARGLSPRRIIDMATLTGACVVALGPHTAGLWSNDDTFAAELLASAERAGDHFWRMPLNTQLKEQLKSDVADTKNTGERYGGAITAALFLSEFVGDVPWCHLDIAGPVTTKRDSGASSKGATGMPVATLVELLTR